MCSGISRDDNNIITSIPRVHIIGQRGIGGVLFEALKVNGTKLAQIDSETGQKETFADLLKKSIRTATWMRHKNVHPGNLICICSHNTSDAYIPYIAGLLMGAVTIVLDPDLPKNQIIHLLDEIRNDLKMIFTTENTLPILYEWVQYSFKKPELFVFGENFNNNFLLKLNLFEKYFDPYKPPDLMETSMIYLSSGCTGQPKAIYLSHYTVLFWVKHPYNKPSLKAKKRLVYTNPYWIFNGIQTIYCITAGICRVLGKFNPNLIWSEIDRHKIRFLSLLPLQAIEMCKAKRLSDNGTTLKNLLLIGTPISSYQIEFLKEILQNCNIYQTYGQTETGGTTTYFNYTNAYHKKLFTAKPSSCGLPLGGFQLKIVDLDTREALGPNKAGELLVKSVRLMNGYLNCSKSDPEFYENGWFKTGDVLYYDKDFCFYFVERVKEILQYKQFLIWPAYIEKILLSHPAVAEATVIGIPHDDDVCHLLGLVLLNDNINVSSEQLLEYVDARTPQQSLLRRGIIILDDFPRCPSGKLDRYKLKCMFQAEESDLHYSLTVLKQPIEGYFPESREHTALIEFNVNYNDDDDQ